MLIWWFKSNRWRGFHVNNSKAISTILGRQQRHSRFVYLASLIDVQISCVLGSWLLASKTCLKHQPTWCDILVLECEKKRAHWKDSFRENTHNTERQSEEQRHSLKKQCHYNTHTKQTQTDANRHSQWNNISERNVACLNVTMWFTESNWQLE